MTTAQDQQSRAADLHATIDMLDECTKAGKPWPYVPSTASIRAVLDELEAARALPATQQAKWFLHTLDNTEGIPGNAPEEKVTEDEAHPFGIPGRDFSAEFTVTSQPLFTAAQVQSMGRVPLTDEQIEQATGAKRGHPLFLAAKGFTIAVEAAHGITHPTGD